VDIKAAKYHFRQHPGDQLAACGTLNVCDGTPELMIRSPARRDFSAEKEENHLFIETTPNPFSTATTIRFRLDEDGPDELSLPDISAMKAGSRRQGVRNKTGGKILQEWLKSSSPGDWPRQLPDNETDPCQVARR
jgi:hypothetical protein